MANTLSVPGRDPGILKAQFDFILYTFVREFGLRLMTQEQAGVFFRKLAELPQSEVGLFYRFISAARKDGGILDRVRTHANQDKLAVIQDLAASLEVSSQDVETLKKEMGGALLRTLLKSSSSERLIPDTADSFSALSAKLNSLGFRGGDRFSGRPYYEPGATFNFSHGELGLNVCLYRVGQDSSLTWIAVVNTHPFDSNKQLILKGASGIMSFLNNAVWPSGKGN